MNTKRMGVVVGAAVLLSACVTLPGGPSVMVLPGSGRSFDDFRLDEATCRNYAYDQVGGNTAGQAAAQSGVASAAVGTAVGAVAGAAIGGQRGAGVGAGAGMVVGSMAGTGTAGQSSWGLQRRYDNAYLQCMYAKGHQIPVSSGQYTRYRDTAPAATTPARPIPPPPAGTPPPPPPGVTAPR